MACYYGTLFTRPDPLLPSMRAQAHTFIMHLSPWTSLFYIVLLQAVIRRLTYICDLSVLAAFSIYFRYSLEFASAVSNIGDKIGFVREFCSSLRIEVISRVCLAQADALAGGQYILTGPVAFGNWIQLEQTLVEERTNNDLSNAIANLRPDFNHPDNDTIDNMNMMQKAEYLVETLGLGESAIKAAF